MAIVRKVGTYKSRRDDGSLVERDSFEVEINGVTTPFHGAGAAEFVQRCHNGTLFAGGSIAACDGSGLILS